MRFPEFNDEWKRTTLREVADIRGRIGYRGYTTEDLVSEGYGALTIGGKHISQNRLDLSNPDYLSWDKFLESPEIIIEQGDIIIAQRGTLGRSALVKYDIGEATINPSVLILRHKFINASFLHYTLLRDDSISYVMRCASKTSILMISQKQLGDLPIGQTSSAEQERIASFLSLLDERIEAQRQTIEERKKQKKALLQQIFSQSLRFPEFSDEWKQTTLEKILVCHSSTLTERNINTDGSIPIWGASGCVGRAEVDSPITESILIIKDGSGVGRVQYIKKEHYFLATLNSLSSKSGIAHQKFIYYFLSQFDFRQYVSGSGIPHIYFKDYSKASISLPPLAEQERIAKLFTIFDERIEVEEALLACYEMQKRYLLRQMFV